MFSLWKPTEQPKLAPKPPMPNETPSNGETKSLGQAVDQLQDWEKELELWNNFFRNTISELKLTGPLLSPMSSATNERKDDDVDHKFETPAKAIKEYVAQAQKDIKLNQEQLAILAELILKDETSAYSASIKGCDLANKIAHRAQMLVNKILMAIDRGRTVEAVIKSFLSSNADLSEISGKVIERSLYDHIGKSLEEAKDLLFKVDCDFRKFAKLVSKQLEPAEDKTPTLTLSPR